MVETEVEAPSTNGAAPELPKTVAVPATPAFSANQLRQIRALTGLPLEQVLGEAENAWQALAYFELRRQGFAASWDDAGEVGLELVDGDADPTSRGIVTASPDSVDSGA